MLFQWWVVVTAGLAATVLLTGIMVAVQLAGWSRMDLPLILGTMLVADPDRARVFGFAIHLALGLLYALLYAAAFSLVGTATWWLGGLLGLFHGLAALTVLLRMLVGVHPRMASDRAGPRVGALLEPPGLLGLHYGTTTPLFTLVAHMAFGAALGALLSLAG